MLISTTCGFENFETGSAKSYVFVVPTTEFKLKEAHIGIVAKSGGPVRLAGSPEHYPAAPGMRDETGRWTRANYEVPEGLVLKVFMQRNGHFGSMRVMASQLLRMRNNAAYRKVGTILTGNPHAQFSRVWIEGRFDLLSVADAEQYGVLIPPHFRTGFQPVMQRRGFEYVVTDPELAPVPVKLTVAVHNSAGERVEIPTVRRNRALDL